MCLKESDGGVIPLGDANERRGAGGNDHPIMATDQTAHFKSYLNQDWFKCSQSFIVHATHVQVLRAEVLN